MSAAYTHFSVCLHGIDAGKIRLRPDERHNALYLELDDDADIRLDLNLEAFGRNRADEIRRDRDGLLRMAEVAAQAAQELGQLLGLADDEDQAAEETRPGVRKAAALAAAEAEAVRKCNACPAPATCSEFGRCTLEAEPEPDEYDPGPEADAARLAAAAT